MHEVILQLCIWHASSLQASFSSTYSTFCIHIISLQLCNNHWTSRQLGIICFDYNLDESYSSLYAINPPQTAAMHCYLDRIHLGTYTCQNSNAQNFIHSYMYMHLLYGSKEEDMGCKGKGNNIEWCEAELYIIPFLFPTHILLLAIIYKNTYV